MPRVGVDSGWFSKTQDSSGPSADPVAHGAWSLSPGGRNGEGFVAQAPPSTTTGGSKAPTKGARAYVQE